MRIGAGSKPTPIVFNGGTYSEGPVQSTIPTSQTALIVGKITWGATPGAPDMIEIYTPGADLVLDTPTAHTAVLNQASFNVLSMWGNGPCPEFDEIRFGASYADVCGQGRQPGKHTLIIIARELLGRATCPSIRATGLWQPDGLCSAVGQGATTYFFWQGTAGGNHVDENGDQPTPKATAWHARADCE